VRNLLFFFGEFLQGLSRNRFLHFTYGAQVTVSLVVLGIFFVLLVGAAVLWVRLGAGMEVHVFVEDGLSAQQNLQLEQNIKNLAHVAEVRWRSKQEAWEIYCKRNPSIPLGDLLKSEGSAESGGTVADEDNPFPASYLVKVDRPGNISGVAQQCQKMDGVYRVNYGAEVVEKYLKVFSVLVLVCLVTIGLLVVFTYSSINNIIGLSVYSRRAEIRIMQLVGATWWFIRWPFIIEGVFFGVAGALIAIAVVTGLLATLGEALRVSRLDLALPWIGLRASDLFLGLVVLLLGLGLGVGFFGSLRKVNGFLRREAEVQIDAQRIQQLMR
jgi:cell division transport system permease protein